MNRIFKFRVWDKKNKQFINEDIGGYVINEEDIELNKIFLNKEYVFQQFIGLLDKNNKPIYEGDIVEVTFEHFGAVSVSKGDTEYTGRGHVFYNKESAAFRLQLKSGSTYCFKGGKNLKIIGNTFETSELLK